MPLEERVCRVISGYQFELCKNVMHRLDAQTSQRRVVQQKEETSRVTLPVDAQEGVVTATTVVEDESTRNNVITAAILTQK